MVPTLNYFLAFLYTDNLTTECKYVFVVWHPDSVPESFFIFIYFVFEKVSRRPETRILVILVNLICLHIFQNTLEEIWRGKECLISRSSTEGAGIKSVKPNTQDLI